MEGRRGDTVLDARGISGKEWRLKFVKVLGSVGEGVASSTVAVVENVDNGKVLCAKRQFADSEDKLNRLIREAALWKQAGVNAVKANEKFPGCVEIVEDDSGQWPSCIVRLYDCLVLPGKPQSVVFLMEYVSNPSIPRHPSETEILSIAKHVCNGIIWLRDAGIAQHGCLHRDHVLLDAEGHARVGGFGLSRIRANGSKKVPDDVFALGSLLYELQVGDAPPADPDSRLRSLAKTTDCSDAMVSLLQTLLSHDTLLSADLARYEIAMAQTLVPNSAPSTTRRTRKHEKRERKLAKELAADAPLADTAVPQRGEKMGSLPERGRKVDGNVADESTPAPGPQRTTAVPTRTPTPEKSLAVDKQGASVASSSVPTRKKAAKEDSRASGFAPMNGVAALRKLSKLKGKRNEGASLESMVNRAIDNKPTALSAKYIKYLVVEAHGLEDFGDRLFEILYKKPLEKSRFMAFKVVAVLHNLCLEGPPLFLLKVAEQKQFLSWVGRDPAGAESAEHGAAKAYSRGETKSFAELVFLKAQFVKDFEAVFQPNWSRATFEVGKDPLDSRQKTIVYRIAEYLQKMEQLALALVEDESTAELSCSVVPMLALETTAAYTSACLIVEGTAPDERHKLAASFASTHKSTVAIMDGFEGNPAAAEACHGEILLNLPRTPPNLSEDHSAPAASATASSGGNLVPTRPSRNPRSVRGSLERPDEERGSPTTRDEREKPEAVRRLPPERPPTRNSSTDEFRAVTNTGAVPMRKPRRDSAAPLAGEVRSSSSPAMLGSQTAADDDDGDARGDSLQVRKGGVAAREAEARPGSNVPRPPVVADDKDRSVRGKPAPPRDPEPRPPVESTRRPPRAVDDEERRRKDLAEDRRRPSPERGPPKYDRDEYYDEDPDYRRGYRDEDPDYRRGYRDEDPYYRRGYRGEDERHRPSDRRRSMDDRYEYESWRDRGVGDGEMYSDGERWEDRRYRDYPSRDGHRGRERRNGGGRRDSSVSRSESEDDRETKPKARSKKKGAKKANGKKEKSEPDEATSHVRDKPISDLRALKLSPKYQAQPSEIQYGTLLGQGGFGSVYKGKFRGQVVAVKCAHPSLATNPKSVDEFRREVAVLGALQHPNILGFIGACTVAPNLIIILEYMAHGTLFDYLHKENKQLTWPLWKQMALDICQGMMYLHSANLLHRDLKSSNLMLGDKFIVKIGDFGLTRVQEQMGPMTGQCGTFQYMAPEVLHSMPYSEKADMFSFGIILWEMAAKQLPYFGMQPMQVGMAVANQGMRPKLAQDWPHPVKIMMQKCWHADSRQRPTFAQCREFLLTLQL